VTLCGLQPHNVASVSGAHTDATFATYTVVNVARSPEEWLRATKSRRHRTDRLDARR
jgi:hypothetical protein